MKVVDLKSDWDSRFYRTLGTPNCTGIKVPASIPMGIYNFGEGVA
jgi:hypothetical protein